MIEKALAIMPALFCYGRCESRIQNRATTHFPPLPAIKEFVGLA